MRVILSRVLNVTHNRRILPMYKKNVTRGLKHELLKWFLVYGLRCTYFIVKISLKQA